MRTSKSRRLYFDCELWSINRILRWTGWRVFVAVSDAVGEPTRVGLIFYGWSGWREWL